MTWTHETSLGFESDKIACHAVPYLQGEHVLDLGCGMRKVWPSVIGIDNGKAFGQHTIADIHSDCTDLSLFADESCDAIFSSHLLEHIPREDVVNVLNEWARVLKIGGHLVLYLPSANLYPKCGEVGANPDHKWDIYPGDIEQLFRDGAISGFWAQLEGEERSQANEYSLFLVFRKDLTSTNYGRPLNERVWQRNPDGKKRALVIRYGAIGDVLQTAGVFKLLKAQGYQLTVNCKPSTQEVILHDPNVDEWLIQDTDFVPNEQLGPYWEQLKERYDLIINHCESIEGALLAMPGRLNHQYPIESRRKIMGTVNYHERLHDIAGVEHDFSGSRFWATKREEERVNEFLHQLSQPPKRINQPIVAWAINGTSYHKTYPYTHITVAKLVSQGIHVILLGGKGTDEALCEGLLDAMRIDRVDLSHVTNLVGKKSIRYVLTLVQHVHCVVGPETGIVNSVGFMSIPKVIYLSHSSQTNLTKHWKNVRTLTPDSEMCPCYPCHQLHFTWEHCNQSEKTKAALCASSIPPDKLAASIIDMLSI